MSSNPLPPNCFSRCQVCSELFPSQICNWQGQVKRLYVKKVSFLNGPNCHFHIYIYHLIWPNLCLVQYSMQLTFLNGPFRMVQIVMSFSYLYLSFNMVQYSMQLTLKVTCKIANTENKTMISGTYFRYQNFPVPLQKQ